MDESFIYPLPIQNNLRCGISNRSSYICLLQLCYFLCENSLSHNLFVFLLYCSEMNGFLSAQSGIWSVFFIFWVCPVLLRLLPLILQLSLTKANPAVFVRGIFLFSWQRGALSDFGVPFRGSSRKDNRLLGRIGTTNTNGLQEELCSRQSTHTHCQKHSPYLYWLRPRTKELSTLGRCSFLSAIPQPQIVTL